MSATRDIEFHRLSGSFQYLCSAVLSDNPDNFEYATMLIDEFNLDPDKAINAKGESLLCIAAGEGLSTACFFLLNKGASLYGSPTTPGWHAPITKALRNGHLELGQQLITKVIADEKCDRARALGASILVAVGTANLKLLEELIQHKANINAVNDKGRSALHMMIYHLTSDAPIAGMKNPLQFTQILLNAGIDVTLKCEDKTTEDRSCPWMPVFPGEPDFGYVETSSNSTALEIASYRLNTPHRILPTIPDRDLLKKFCDAIQYHPRKHQITDSLSSFFRTPLIKMVLEYAVPDSEEIKATNTP